MHAVFPLEERELFGRPEPLAAIARPNASRAPSRSPIFREAGMASDQPACPASLPTPLRATIRLLASTAFLLAVSARSDAQNIGATLQGLVTDAQKGVLPGVSVTIVNVDTGRSRTVVTDNAGWYRAAALAPGTYELSTELTGFVSYKRSGMTLTTGQEPRIDITLQVAAVKETVQVTAAAPLVDTTKNTIGMTVTRKHLDSIPLVSRNFLDLANLTPGVTGVGGGGVNTAGQLNRNNSYLVDGVSNDDTIVSSSRGGFSLEAVREYVVLANQFSAEYGISSGAIVSVVTRSGTNTNQGRAFFFTRNDALDAQDPFSHAQGSGKAPFSQQRGGGFWGGPIARDHLFYFASYEGQHIEETSVVTSTLVPVDQREWPKPTTQHQAFVKFDKAVNLPQWRKEKRFQFVENFSVTKSQHDLKFGTDISIIRGFSYFPRTNDGSFVFSTDKPFNPADLSTYPIQYTVEHFNPYFDLPNELYAFFAQDNWRMRGGLTLNV